MTVKIHIQDKKKWHFLNLSLKQGEFDCWIYDQWGHLNLIHKVTTLLKNIDSVEKFKSLLKIFEQNKIPNKFERDSIKNLLRKQIENGYKPINSNVTRLLTGRWEKQNKLSKIDKSEESELVNDKESFYFEKSNIKDTVINNKRTTHY